MTTTTVKLSPGTVTNIAPITQTAPMATNTATVTVQNECQYVLLKVRIVQNDDQDVPTVQGSATLIVTVVDSGSTTILTTVALKGIFNTTTVASVPTDYYFAFPFNALGGGASVATPPTGTTDGIFTIVSTVSAGDADQFIYQVDAVAVAAGEAWDNPFITGSGPQGITASGSEGYVGP